MRTQIPLLILLSVRGYAEITSSADLNCDFSTACHWRNATGPEDSGEWIVSNRYEGDPLHLITTRKAGDGFFAYTSGFMGRTVSLLVSEVISCQLGGGNVKYWYFKTGIESQLEVCIRQPPGSKDVNALRCYDGLSPNFIQQWIFRVIELPPLSQPFELVFRGTFYPPLDVIALTEINYTSTLCEISNNGAEQSAGGSFATEDVTASRLVDFSEGNDVEFTPFGSEWRAPPAHRPTQRALNFAAPTAGRAYSEEQSSPRIGAAFTPLCPLIDCTFDDNTYCNYVTSISEQDQVNASLREWSISSGAVLNSLTGVPHDLTKTGTFIYAGGTTVSPEDTFILSSKVPVELKEPARLDFFVYQAGIKGRLQVCLNTVSNCALNIKGSTIDNKTRRWKNYHVPLSTSTHAIHFVADELQDNYAIGLDHIQLLNKYGMAAQLCN
ncbi:hypothetical protein V3C99_006825 [Haemonchus contortus]